MHKKIILVTSGEPAGIGPDICLDLAMTTFSQANYVIVVIGDARLLQERAKLLNKPIKIIKVDIASLANYTNCLGQLLVLDVPCPNPNCLGKLEVINASYVLATLNLAISLCNDKLSTIIVTAPISKEIINQAGIRFSGHTEYFAQQFACKKVVMMLANAKLKVALLTTHLPLKEVPAQVTSENLNQTLSIILSAFSHQFGIAKPKIGVCGLNPHAGEGGYLGNEEVQIINPVIRQWQVQGHNVSGSYPADTIFNYATNFDVILAMYHDQGLPVLKYSGFNSGINITLGLPIIRTSVDHGTALKLAGSGDADSSSLIEAVKFAMARDVNIVD